MAAVLCPLAVHRSAVAHHLAAASETDGKKDSPVKEKVHDARCTMQECTCPLVGGDTHNEVSAPF
jgi:hypothetical protein